MLILAADTSGKALSLCLAQWQELEDREAFCQRLARSAVCDEAKILAARVLDQGYTHSLTFMPALEGLLQDCGYTLQDIDLFAICAGPGSYTGIRIGLSSFKTLAWMEDKALIALPSLEIMAWPYRSAAAYVLAAIDARSGRAFSALFRGGEQLLPIENIAAEAYLPKVLALAKDAPIYLLGDGSAVYLEAIKQLAPAEAERFVLMNPHASALRAEDLAQAALLAYLSGSKSSKYMDAAAEYHSLSQAERLRQEQA